MPAQESSTTRFCYLAEDLSLHLRAFLVDVHKVLSQPPLGLPTKCTDARWSRKRRNTARRRPQPVSTRSLLQLPPLLLLLLLLLLHNQTARASKASI